jgi:ribosome-associated protein
LKKLQQKEASLELAQWIAKQLDKKGAHDIKVLETIPGTYIADYLVLATGTSSRHMQTLLDSPCAELKKLGYPPLHVEGEDSTWMLADLGDIVIHIFDPETRNHFDLEDLWKNAPRVDWTGEEKNGSHLSLSS